MKLRPMKFMSLVSLASVGVIVSIIAVSVLIYGYGYHSPPTDEAMIDVYVHNASLFQNAKTFMYKYRGIDALDLQSHQLKVHDATGDWILLSPNMLPQAELDVLNRLANNLRRIGVIFVGRGCSGRPDSEVVFSFYVEGTVTNAHRRSLVWTDRAIDRLAADTVTASNPKRFAGTITNYRRIDAGWYIEDLRD